ncbi:hypothetical protein FF2_036062 [Malus domestica]
MTGDDAAEKDWRLFDIWDRRFDKLPLASSIFELASSNSELASSISEIPSSADFFIKARCSFQSTLEFSLVKIPLLYF